MITFNSALVFALVFLAIVTYLGKAIDSEKLKTAARNFGIALLLLLIAWLLGGGWSTVS